jgi:GntR family transcriptional regulator
MDTELLGLKLSERSGEPFYGQIADQLAELIHAGRLSGGHKLPSVRELARVLLVSVITTQRAYAELASRGLIVSRRGAGTFVVDDAAAAAADWAFEEAEAGLRGAVQRALRLGVGVEQVGGIVASELGVSDA